LRKGNYTNVTKEDMYIMTRIIQGNPPNLGMIIVKKMVKAVKWCKNPANDYGLPYGKLVSLLIGNECRVPTHEHIDHKVALQKVDESTFHKMDFKWNERAKEWQKTQPPSQEAAPEPTTEAAEEVNEESAVPEPDTSAAAGPSTSAAAGPSTSEAAALTPREITNSDLSAMITRRFTVLDSAVARMNANINEVKNEVARLHSRHDDIEAHMWELSERMAAPGEDEEAPDEEDEEGTDKIDSNELTDNIESDGMTDKVDSDEWSS